ncbi:Hpt domain-containing protein [Chachezhania antarctica]|uniref:Hpt domain-containing protein n=1 Tax=Chachezhania antarctica TaxID=2340860 RepID=UPI000EAF3076|nr:Hpt domain-containing protein [Chachezhania antarctica]|tara:strand:+ start:1816 stop:2136 length:321 start_codon:yes stop_codon:yes gene_type:complete
MIDWSRVDELRNEVCASDFTEVVDLFLEEVSDAIEILPRAAAQGELEQAMHFLKGSSASLGFRSFSVKCRNGEKMAAEGRASDIDLAELAIEFQRSKAAFLNGLGK